MNPPKRTKAKGSPDGFTLVELLVVIAIIGILVALVMPVIGKAMGRAKRLKCQAQLNELGKGMRLYTMDHHQVLPPVFVNGVRQWAGEISSYLGKEWSGMDPASPASQRTIFFCPEALKLHPGDYTINHGSYGMNKNLNNRQITRVDNPSSRLMLADGAWDTTPKWWDAGVSEINPSEFIHRDGADIVFLDNHVAWLSAQDYASHTNLW